MPIASHFSRQLCLSSLVLAAAVGPATTAIAQTAFLEITAGQTDGWNTPAFDIEVFPGNTLRITSFRFELGSSSFNFDEVYEEFESFIGGNGNETATLIEGDREQNEARTTAFEYEFDGFDLDERFTTEADVDRTSGDSIEDAREIFFNNGSAPNAIATVGFSNGRSASLVLPDGLFGQSRYFYIVAVPGPSSATLVAIGGLVLTRRRR
ncbi:MAG: hypothetical protein AAF747_04400 [Planctomycetota bacterium]